MPSFWIRCAVQRPHFSHTMPRLFFWFWSTTSLPFPLFFFFHWATQFSNSFLLGRLNLPPSPLNEHHTYRSSHTNIGGEKRRAPTQHAQQRKYSSVCACVRLCVAGLSALNRFRYHQRSSARVSSRDRGRLRVQKGPFSFLLLCTYGIEWRRVCLRVRFFFVVLLFSVSFFSHVFTDPITGDGRRPFRSSPYTPRMHTLQHRWRHGGAGKKQQYKERVGERTRIEFLGEQLELTLYM